jgi:hypothetical protein
LTVIVETVGQIQACFPCYAPRFYSASFDWPAFVFIKPDQWAALAIVPVTNAS